MPGLSEQERLDYAINWIHAALQACSNANLEPADTILSLLGTFTVARGNAPFVEKVPGKRSFPPPDDLWLFPLFHSVFKGTAFSRNQLQVYTELRGAAIRSTEANEPPRPTNNYHKVILLFLESLLARLDFSDTGHVMANWLCCSNLMRCVQNPLQGATTELECYSPEVFLLTEPLLADTLPRVAMLFCEVLGEYHPGRRYLNNILKGEDEPCLCELTPSFGLGC